MADDGIKYETKTARAVRGMEARTVSKWEEEGWEVVSQSRGKLQTEITLRKPKSTLPRMRYLVGGGVAVVALAAIVAAVAITSQGGARPRAGTAATATKKSETSIGAVEPSPTASTTAASAKTETVLTSHNNPELAALLKLRDNCDSSIGAFARDHEGQTIAFDGSIGAMNSHNGKKTLYDILIGAGNSETSSGPSFQFRDVNPVFDLHYTQDPPESIGVGTNLHVKATVGEYTPNHGCLLRLVPVATTVR